MARTQLGWFLSLRKNDKKPCFHALPGLGHLRNGEGIQSSLRDPHLFSFPCEQALPASRLPFPGREEGLFIR